ncbi:MAG: DUF3791 domain-containing protein [Paludibacteraceae bacterium]|nr:DUF3791 domain-containing protein [Paludibacteraceae bacterium]
MKENEPLYFLSFCVEAYKMRHHLTGNETMKLFDKTGATQYIIDGYNVLHTQGERWIVEDIEEFIQQHS